MANPCNHVVQVMHYGVVEELEVVDAPQTMRQQPPFVLGYDVVGRSSHARA